VMSQSGLARQQHDPGKKTRMIPGFCFQRMARS
jgi:hypothetical protein